MKSPRTKEIQNLHDVVNTKQTGDNMWYQIVKINKLSIEMFKVEIFSGAEVRIRRLFNSEAGARTYLAELGVPFAKQHRLAVAR